RPFDMLAKNGGGLTSEDLLGTARSLLQRGLMRRFGAVIPTRKPGFSASAMGVWVVPEQRVDEIGARMSQNKAVSHCYLRPVYDDWPYNLYTIVHGRWSTSASRSSTISPTTPASTRSRRSTRR